MIQLLALFFGLAGALDIPTQMTSGEQVRALEVVGLGTTSKFLSNAYPLGGYSGFEVSLSMASMDTGAISNLGSTTRRTEDFYYPTITLGKGLYNDSDIFIHFMPPSKTTEVSNFGASYRWGFYQALFLPLNFSLIAHAGTSNIKNRITTKNLGADLMIGMTLEQFSFFIGGGYANSSGQFTGGTSGVTLSNQSENHKVDSSHFMFGGTYNFDPFFVGLSLDRYVEAVYSFKTGFLF